MSKVISRSSDVFSMNTEHLYWGNKRLIGLTQKALLDFLNERVSGEIKAADPFSFEIPKPVQIQCLGALRLNSKNMTGIIPIGSEKGDVLAKLGDSLKPEFKNNAEANKKPIEEQLLGALTPALLPELAANQLNVDPKNIIQTSGALLGKWSCVSVNRYIRFAYATSTAELKFDLPVFDQKYREKFIAEHYGFSENVRIMLVDDSATTRMLSRHYLSAAGYLNVDECDDGRAALQKLKSSRPVFDLVVADWHMPAMTGIELLKSVRSMPEFKYLPFILATGERNKDEVSTAVKSGVSGYIVKPFSADALYAAMKRAHAALAALGLKAA